jgi:hypothetical protein
MERRRHEEVLTRLSEFGAACVDAQTRRRPAAGRLRVSAVRGIVRSSKFVDFDWLVRRADFDPEENSNAKTIAFDPVSR